MVAQWRTDFRKKKKGSKITMTGVPSILDRSPDLTAGGKVNHYYMNCV